MDAATIQKIVDLAPVTNFTISDLPYISKELHLVVPPQVGVLKVSTLDGFVNLLEAGVDPDVVSPSAVLIHVTGPSNAELVQREADKYGRRQTHIVATLLEGLTKFPYFNQFGAQEDFVIGLQAHFQENQDLLDLIQLASHIDIKDQVSLVDDGRAQEVTIQRGVAFKEKAETKKRTTLKPFRTFRELDQPASDFIFRVKAGGGFALFEADGGAWKITAIAEIAAWLSHRLQTSVVTGLDAIPIIS